MWMEGIYSSPARQIIEIGWNINGRFTTMKGLFGDLFDFNHDGKMSAFERAAEMSFFHEMISEEKEYEETELELSGLDPDEYDF